jgi:CO/xanthine dehydrogenase FAD-binding subunit
VRSDPREYRLVAPATLAEALAALADDTSVRPLAGGTDLMVVYAMGRLADRALLGLWKLHELRGIVVDEAYATLGALTTYAQVQAHPTLRAEFPMLVQAAAETGGLAIQNRGTLGGNLANASPAADSSPPLLAYDAELELVSSRGARWLRYDAFHLGYKRTQLAPGELISRIRLPRRASEVATRTQLFRKVGPRRAQAISKVCLAARIDRSAAGAIVATRVAFGGVGPVATRCPLTEAALLANDTDAALAALATEIAPIDDHRSTARYRLQVARNLVSRIAGVTLPLAAPQNR